MEEILKVEGIYKNFGQFKILKDVNMTVNKGDIYGFVGRNGAGKTTLIRVITGLITPQAGKYELNITKRKGSISAIVEAPAIKALLSVLKGNKKPSTDNWPVKVQNCNF